MTQAKTEQAIFGAGCFWGVQYYFDQVPGVTKSVVGYSGGDTENPDWHNTHDNETGHAEVVRLDFDPELIMYETLVRHFFRLHNPTYINSDGINMGSNYRSAIFYYDDVQKDTALMVRDEVQKMYSEPIATEISLAKKFWDAEPFHQKFTERTGRGTCHVPYEPIESGVSTLPEPATTASKIREWLQFNTPHKS